MNVDRPLKLAGAAVACFGTFMLGVSEENYALAAVAVAVSTTAYVVCDRLEWFCFNTLVSNLAALGAMALAATQFAATPVEERILVVADLMGYLQFILQFRKKTTRNYWLIVVVSLLQVSVAAALQTGIGFAVMLVAYLFSGILFLGLFFQHREQARFQAAAEKTDASNRRRGFGFVGLRQIEDDPAPVKREFSRRMSGLVVGTIALSAFFFVAVPRMGQTQWSPADIVAARAVGFTPEINLTRSGQMIEDADVVMQVYFSDPITGKPYQVDGELYLRGTSVSHYADGRWRRSYSGFLRGGLPPMTDAPIGHDLVRQKVTLEPLSSVTVFSCYPFYAEQPTGDLNFNPVLGQIARQEQLRTQRYQYSLLTTAFVRNRQARLIPAVQRPDVARSDRNGGPKWNPFGDLLQMPEPKNGVDPLAGLRALARQLVASIPESDVYERARVLESHLRDSGRFSYSLTAVERPDDVDPLEDFVVNRPSGHCEFFAGALAMMLRSVGIRSRIVLGYRGGEWNAVGNFHQFQQLHAHSWVEAYLPPESVPRERLASKQAEENGAWLQLDGTSGFTVATAAASGSTWYALQQTLDYLRYLWNNYVLGMDAARQRDEVYRPVVGTVVRSFEMLADRAANWFEAAKNSIVDRGPFPGELSWDFRTVAVVLVMAATIAAACRVIVAWMRRRRRTAKPGGVARPRREAPVVDFYVRLEHVLRSRKLVRSADQTQREFVQSACGELAERPETRSVASLPRKIVEAFYRVRFGSQSLDAREQAEIEQALAALAGMPAAPDPTPGGAA